MIDFCGGYKCTPKKLIMGGPMMGTLVFDDTYPVLKNNNALLAFDESQTAVYEEQPCIRCGGASRLPLPPDAPYDRKGL